MDKELLQKKIGLFNKITWIGNLVAGIVILAMFVVMFFPFWSFEHSSLVSDKVEDGTRTITATYGTAKVSMVKYGLVFTQIESSDWDLEVVADEYRAELRKSNPSYTQVVFNITDEDGNVVDITSKDIDKAFYTDEEEYFLISLEELTGKEVDVNSYTVGSVYLIYVLLAAFIVASVLLCTLVRRSFKVSFTAVVAGVLGILMCLLPNFVLGVQILRIIVMVLCAIAAVAGIGVTVIGIINQKAKNALIKLQEEEYMNK